MIIFPFHVTSFRSFTFICSPILTHCDLLHGITVIYSHSSFKPECHGMATGWYSMMQNSWVKDNRQGQVSMTGSEGKLQRKELSLFHLHGPDQSSTLQGFRTFTEGVAPSQSSPINGTRISWHMFSLYIALYLRLHLVLSPLRHSELLQMAVFIYKPLYLL